MNEYLLWIVYNAITFGSLYGFAKLIEHYTWNVIENYEDYTKLIDKWRLQWR
jgi:hypothetical protein